MWRTLLTTALLLSKKMASEAISEHLISKNFLGEHAPDPPVLHAYTSHTPLQKFCLRACQELNLECRQGSRLVTNHTHHSKPCTLFSEICILVHVLAVLLAIGKAELVAFSPSFDHRSNSRRLSVRPARYLCMPSTVVLYHKMLSYFSGVTGIMKV